MVDFILYPDTLPFNKRVFGVYGSTETSELPFSLISVPCTAKLFRLQNFVLSCS